MDLLLADHDLAALGLMHISNSRFQRYSPIKCHDRDFKGSIGGNSGRPLCPISPMRHIESERGLLMLATQMFSRDCDAGTTKYKISYKQMGLALLEGIPPRG
ncbi:MAG: hypothetical protein JOZ16_18230 [Methylobacteriaceae bacterium]|nr:hypothetical protein [Methylobacteriaceae bacterium]